MANTVITPRVQARMDSIAEIVANGGQIKDAAVTLGITKGEAANAWRRIRARLGSQAV